MRISRKTHLCSELCLAYASHNDLDFVRTQRNRVLFRQIVLLRPRHEILIFKIRNICMNVPQLCFLVLENIKMLSIRHLKKSPYDIKTKASNK